MSRHTVYLLHFHRPYRHGFVIARTWNGGRDLERRLKNRKNSLRLCPICRQAGKEV